MTAPNEFPEEQSFLRCPDNYFVYAFGESLYPEGVIDITLPFESLDNLVTMAMTDYTAMCSALDAKARECEEFEAKIDRLMMEYCPEEMTQAQIDNWAKNQRPVDAEREATIDAARSEGEK